MQFWIISAPAKFSSANNVNNEEYTPEDYNLHNHNCDNLKSNNFTNAHTKFNQNPLIQSILNIYIDRTPTYSVKLGYPGKQCRIPELTRRYILLLRHNFI
jgi:hypothetical protein